MYPDYGPLWPCHLCTFLFFCVNKSSSSKPYYMINIEPIWQSTKTYSLYIRRLCVLLVCVYHRHFVNVERWHSLLFGHQFHYRSTLYVPILRANVTAI